DNQNIAHGARPFKRPGRAGSPREPGRSMRPPRSADRDGGETAAVGADEAGRAGDAVGPAAAAGGGARRTARPAAGAACAAGLAGPGRLAVVAARAEEDAGLARVAARLVLVAVVDEDLDAVRVAGHEGDVPDHLGAVPFVHETRRRRVRAAEVPVVLG